MAIRVEPPVCYVFRWGCWQIKVPNVLRLPGDPRCTRLTCQYGMLQDESRCPGTKGEGDIRAGRCCDAQGDTCVHCVRDRSQGMEGMDE